MSSEIVTLEPRGDVAHIKMDDGKANALSHEMIEQLGAAFDRAENDGKAVLLSGRDGKFCAGFDLRVMMSGPKQAIELVMKGGELLLRLFEFPRPLVVACTGHALAGGALLAATGDTRIGALGSFKIGLNEVAQGMPVPVLAHEFARARLDTRELFASVVQARIYDPQEAVAAGWLDRAVPGDQLMNAATEETERLAKLPATAYKLSKRSLRQPTVEYIKTNMAKNLADLKAG